MAHLSPFHNVSIFRHIAALVVETSEELYTLRRLNLTSRDTIHNYSDEIWRRLIMLSPRLVWMMTSRGDYYTVEKALSLGLYFDSGSTAVSCLGANNIVNHPALDCLLSAGLIRQCGDAFVNACRSYTTDIMQKFIDAGINVNQSGWPTPLTAACEGGRFLNVKLLIDKGAIIKTDRLDTHPLHLAITSHNIHLIDYLLELGLDVNITHMKDGNAITPLHTACCHSDQLVAHLLSRGSKFDASLVKYVLAKCGMKTLKVLLGHLPTFPQVEVSSGDFVAFPLMHNDNLHHEVLEVLLKRSFYFSSATLQSCLSMILEFGRIKLLPYNYVIEQTAQVIELLDSFDVSFGEGNTNALVMIAVCKDESTWNNMSIAERIKLIHQA